MDETELTFRELIFAYRHTWDNPDTQRYRDGYPDLVDDPTANLNRQFYANEIPFRPDGDFIDRIHELCTADFSKLDAHPHLANWLFPLRDSTGHTDMAQALQPHEADAIRDVPELRERFLLSYEMMLGYHGMELRSQETGEVGRSKNALERYGAWASPHHYLRVTRILKCLGEVGFEHFKVPFLKHVLNELYTDTRELQHCFTACTEYWIGTLRATGDQESLQQYEGDLAVAAADHGILPSPIRVYLPKRKGECGCTVQ
eukprot:TRINITY_DN4394_c0_g1_i3.p1 TRINITY_DN4394_c0_g1~~TRINITY_DN4394_c0_g1_i3.p1  ORF type:complete len:259 (+),score=56.27 TRINITY_DN4394_c0_g1_i3:26-802(+)